MIADSAAYQGGIQPGKWAFDFKDSYFEAGDLIQFFYQAETVGGIVETRPPLPSPTPKTIRCWPLTTSCACLPTSGWSCSSATTAWPRRPTGTRPLRYNGYTAYDTYQTQAPSAGLDNGLAGRASGEDIGSTASSSGIAIRSLPLP